MWHGLSGDLPLVPRTIETICAESFLKRFFYTHDHFEKLSFLHLRELIYRRDAPRRTDEHVAGRDGDVRRKYAHVLSTQNLFTRRDVPIIAKDAFSHGRPQGIEP